MKFSRFAMIILMLAMFALAGCGGKKSLIFYVVPSSGDYGNAATRVDSTNCTYYTDKTAPDPKDYDVIAMYSAQEHPLEVKVRTAVDMICIVWKEAVENGADAVIVRKLEVRSIPGLTARNTPYLEMEAIRFKRQVPDFLR